MVKIINLTLIIFTKVSLTVVVYFSYPPRTLTPPRKLLWQKDFLKVPRQEMAVRVRGVTKVRNHGNTW